MSKFILVISGINCNNDEEVREAFASSGMSRYFVINNDCEYQSHAFNFEDADFQKLIANMAKLQAHLDATAKDYDKIILGFKKVEDTKSSNAKRVLQLMDSCEDGASRYMEFVKLVSSEANVTIESLEVELEPYI